MTVQPMLPGHVRDLAALQELVFPALAAAGRIGAEQYLRHLGIFPEGQFVLVADDHLTGSTTTMRTAFDFDNLHHRFRDTFGGGCLTPHQPAAIGCTDWT